MGGQMLFVAFGALVLVPILTGLDPNVAFFTAGVGTLIFQLVTRRTVPIFLASSFAFIAPIIFSVGQWGLPATMGGLIAAGFFYVVLSLIVRVRGSGFLYRLFPPVVVGPVIMVIGLGLAPTAISMANGTANPAINENHLHYSGGCFTADHVAGVDSGGRSFEVNPYFMWCCGWLLHGSFHGGC